MSEDWADHLTMEELNFKPKECKCVIRKPILPSNRSNFGKLLIDLCDNCYEVGA